jgi:phytoene dehydrogenase-like protein
LFFVILLLLPQFNKAMRDIHAGMQVPAIALRADWKVVPIILRRWASSMVALLPYVFDVKKPLAALLDGRIGVTDPFVRRILDLECFLLSGLKAEGTIVAEVAFMVGERANAMEYPIGGTRAIVAAMVRGIEKHGGRVEMNAHVEGVDVAGGRATGVRVRGRGRRAGRRVTARRAVVSNASVWQTFGSLVDAGDLPAQFVRERQETPAGPSFMHAHVAIPSEGLPAGLIGHHAVCLDSGKDVAAPGNTVMISIPTLWSPGLAPPGFHVVHAYTMEEYGRWPGLAEDRVAYEAAKAAAAEPLLAALRHVIPDVDARLRCAGAFVRVGTPVTHERFCRRWRGSYGPGIAAGTGEFAWPGDNPIGRLAHVGDSVFPGIGVPAAAASGIIAATSLVGVREHNALVDRVFPKA